MSDLIDRRAAIDAIKSLWNNAPSAQHLSAMLDCEDAIQALPSAEPERKTAEWIYGENDGQDGWYCSKCGLFIPWYYEYYGLDNIDFIADFRTCPKCDRKMLKYTGMRGEQDDSV